MSGLVNFNGMFKRLVPGACRLDADGCIAVCVKRDLYRSYKQVDNAYAMVDSDEYIVPDPDADDVFFVVPVDSVSEGDVIMVPSDRLYAVSQADPLTLVDYAQPDVPPEVPEFQEKTFISDTYKYGKVVSLTAAMLNIDGTGKGSPLNNVIKYRILLSLFGQHVYLGGAISKLMELDGNAGSAGKELFDNMMLPFTDSQDNG